MQPKRLLVPLSHDPKPIPKVTQRYEYIGDKYVQVGVTYDFGRRYGKLHVIWARREGIGSIEIQSEIDTMQIQPLSSNMIRVKVKRGAPE